MNTHTITQLQHIHTLLYASHPCMYTHMLTYLEVATATNGMSYIIYSILLLVQVHPATCGFYVYKTKLVSSSTCAYACHELNFRSDVGCKLT